MGNSNTRKLIGILRENSRITRSSMAKKSGLTRSMVFRKMKFIDARYVQKYASIINFGKIGFNIHAVFFVVLAEKELHNPLFLSSCINSVMHVSGKHNAMVDAYFSSLSGLSEFEDKIASLSFGVETYFAVETLKQEGFLCLKK